MFTILLYYKYVPISDPEKLKLDQIALCQKLGLTGRIIVSKEGINGTVEGATEAIQEYVKTMRVDVRFADIDFKESPGTGNSFPRLSVKNRPEIVTLGTGARNFDSTDKSGQYISPDELQAWFDGKKDFVIVDMRNDYEHAVGHFENSVRLPVKSFKEIPAAVKNISDLKDKTVVSVCTGGVRCEKASGFLMDQGFSDVYQLEGGMVRYLEKYPGKKFKGSLYVFDGRVAVNYDSPEQHEVVGRCIVCGVPSELCLNCDYPECHGHIIYCDTCKADGVFCSDSCRAKVEGVQSIAV